MSRRLAGLGGPLEAALGWQWLGDCIAEGRLNTLDRATARLPTALKLPHQMRVIRHTPAKAGWALLG